MEAIALIEFIKPKKTMISHWIVPGLVSLDIERMAYITSIVAEKCKVEVYELKSSTRKRPQTEARQLAMYYAIENTKLKLREIGNFFNRDHSSVIYARDTVNDLVRTDRDFCRKFIDIGKLINGN